MLPKVPTELHGQVERSVGAIQQSADGMDKMIGNLVDAAFLESGQLVLHKEVVELKEFLQALLERLETVAEVRRIEAVIPSDLPPIEADPVRLERILVNLLSNALKYSPADSPVRLEARKEADAVTISVIDRGRGIEAEDLPHIFDRFYRTRHGRKGKGIGLGLHIARLLVDYHGKIAFPFASLIVVFFGVPFASVKRRSGLAVQFGISIFLLFIYMVSQKLSQIFGYNGSIHPVLAAWFPNLLFFLAGVFAMLRVQK
ncbi:MAG: LptF/LptG family permease [Bacteroidetes bacterium]|nr:LptF/LptG family permease [Bacteroidota bacterium]